MTGREVLLLGRLVLPNVHFTTTAHFTAYKTDAHFESLFLELHT